MGAVLNLHLQQYGPIDRPLEATSIGLQPSVEFRDPGLHPLQCKQPLNLHIVQVCDPACTTQNAKGWLGVQAL